ncbi:MAG: hypothetical protein MJZ20_11735 [Bacteroidaceae bacterium]|nr:hypothetical protein [Bacteroidaceae bacterium]
MNIFIKCPNCGGELQVTSVEGLESKIAPCPQCKQQNAIKDYLPKLSLKVDDKNYQLHFGRQWVGRKKEGNDAEIQIPDLSMYMSKKHALIELRCTKNGLECTFEEHGKNPTSKEGIELIKGDIIYLNINDCLTLGGKKMYLANEFE